MIILILCFDYTKESRLHRTRNVLARAGLIGVLPDNNDDHYHYHRDKCKENLKIKSISFWNLSNDFYYDQNIEQDFLSKRQINSSQVCKKILFVFLKINISFDRIRILILSSIQYFVPSMNYVIFIVHYLIYQSIIILGHQFNYQI